MESPFSHCAPPPTPPATRNSPPGRRPPQARPCMMASQRGSFGFSLALMDIFGYLGFVDNGSEKELSRVMSSCFPPQFRGLARGCPLSLPCSIPFRSSRPHFLSRRLDSARFPPAPQAEILPRRPFSLSVFPSRTLRTLREPFSVCPVPAGPFLSPFHSPFVILCFLSPSAPPRLRVSVSFVFLCVLCGYIPPSPLRLPFSPIFGNFPLSGQNRTISRGNSHRSRPPPPTFRHRRAFHAALKWP